MAKTRKIIYEFETLNDSGLDKLPLNALVYVKSKQMSFHLRNTQNLTGSTTIEEAIQQQNLIANYDNEVFVKTSADDDSTLAPNAIYLLKTDPNISTVPNYTLKLPKPKYDKAVIQLIDSNGNSQDYPIEIGRNGNKINGLAQHLTLDVNGFNIKLVWDQANSNWILGGVR